VGACEGCLAFGVHVGFWAYYPGGDADEGVSSEAGQTNGTASGGVIRISGSGGVIEEHFISDENGFILEGDDQDAVERPGRSAGNHPLIAIDPLPGSVFPLTGQKRLTPFPSEFQMLMNAMSSAP